jgi:hypothetical protein
VVTSHRQWPIETWPIWKVIGWALLANGGLALLLVFSALTPPLFAPQVIGGISVALAGLGVACALWSRVSHGWWPRLGVGAVTCAFLLGIALRSWSAVAGGLLLTSVMALTIVLTALAWGLPAISDSLSTRIWREQSAPRSAIGRSVLRWGLGLGMGGVGVLGAVIGTSLSRSGSSNIIYLFAGLGMTAVTVLMAQGYSHRMWEDRPWATGEGSSNKGGDGA